MARGRRKIAVLELLYGEKGEKRERGGKIFLFSLLDSYLSEEGKIMEMGGRERDFNIEALFRKRGSAEERKNPQHDLVKKRTSCHRSKRGAPRKEGRFLFPEGNGPS